MGLAAFGILSVVAALPQITADLGNVGLLSWVITAFLLTSAIATVVAGPLIDALGLRAAFRLTIAVFFVGSALSAVAPTMHALILFRGIQGAASGLIVAVVITSIGLVYPAHLRPRAFAATGVVWGVMALSGPTVAALFVATTGWRGIFVVNLPIALGAAALGWSRLPTRRQDAPRVIHFDLPGIALVAAFTTVSLIGLSGFTRRSAVALSAAAVIGVSYWVYSAKASHPVLARRHIAHMPLGGINVAFGATFGAVIGVDAYLPLYVRGGLGRSAAVAAFSVAAVTLGWTTASVVVSRVLDHVSQIPVALASFVLLIPATIAALVFYSSSTPLWVVLLIAMTLGLGVGTQYISLATLLQAQASRTEMGRAAAANQYMRGLFQIYAAALVGAIILNNVAHHIGDVEAVRQLLGGEDIELAAVAADAIATGFRLGHLVTLFFIGISFVLILILRKRLAQPWRREDLAEAAGPVREQMK